MKVVGIIGSLRVGSYNRSLMHAFAAQKPEGIEMDIADISTLPFFNEDNESALPETVQVLKTKVEEADIIIIATPEYNRSVPGVLKNAIDLLSRPYGKNSFAGKKVFVVSASSGAIGGALAQYDLKKSLLHSNAVVVGQPEFFVGNAGSKFDETGTLIDENTKKHIASAWEKIST
jgi:chromate reductase, NAD(P)H dehydrogenase (quinone)